ncbi:sensor histidine kinase [Dyella halodurans]|uniref:Sensor histidine kinase n=2 Tax=Dyella halodurans TaxID=1920171 RepID=A0ABV9C5U9_9GAMM|nr:histidine kinase [Dyella halodurans]
MPLKQARMDAYPVPESPSRLLTFVIGWVPCTLASSIGALAVLHDAPRQALFDLLLWLAYSLAAGPFAWILRATWRANLRFSRAVPLLLLTSFLLAMLVSIPQYELATRLGLIRPAPLWPALLIRMQGCWFLLIIFAAFYWVAGYSLLAMKRREREEQAVALARDAELVALRYQLQPHFLFNALNAISTLIVERHTDQATRMIARLGDFLRLTLIGDGRHEVSLADELNATASYLDIERARLGDRLSITMQVGPEVMPCRVPWLFMQPLLENAIRHGIATRPEGGRIDVEASRDGDHLCVRVRSDGAWRERASSSLDGPGIGLSNIQARLSKLYGDADALVIQQGQDDVTVTVRIPFVTRPYPEAP